MDRANAEPIHNDGSAFEHDSAPSRISAAYPAPWSVEYIRSGCSVDQRLRTGDQHGSTSFHSWVATQDTARH